MKSHKKLLCIFLIGLIIQSIICAIDLTSVFGQPLIITLKWRANAGTGSTWMGPLAADLNNDGLMEIVISGLNGRTAALDPLTGNVIWSVPYGGDHVPMEIIDLNKDGIPEILMGPQYINGSSGGVLALHGNNGSVYWYNPNAACKGTYIAVADINADGYPEIYTATPGRITALTYDGRIFASTYTYYTCWGGMTIGDTDFDGVFEVYLGERHTGFDPRARGLRAFWADNLTEIWAHPDILCSSQAPVLADVDKNGDLEIIVLHQRKGIAVINTDGTPYRKQLTISGLPSNGHTNPTIADVDGDGNFELLHCGQADLRWYTPAIFDLVKWQVEATLPFTSIDPPGVADIDGDGKLEIIAPNRNNVTIFKYNAHTQKYDIIGTIPLAVAHPFFIAQDIDDDGKLELIFNQYNSWINVYDVETPAPTPLPRSGLYFYSQYRTRVPVYMPPPGPQAPKITAISPNDGAANVSVTLSQLTFKLTDYQSDPINYTVTTSPNIGSASGINVPNGIITVPVNGLAYSTTYTWTVTATDGNNPNAKTFTFSTEEVPPGQGNVVLTISTVGNGSVIKNPDNETYAYGTLVQLTAKADIGYAFSNWDGDLTGNKNPTTILMNGNKTVTAVFNKTEYILSINISPIEGGYVNVNKTAPYHYGDIVELTVVPNAGWSFSHWEGNLSGSQNPATITIDDNKTVTAVFTQDHYTLTITVLGNGNVTIEPNKPVYTYGENVTLTATADPDWMFAGWSGDASSSENPITIMINGNKSITAIFTQNPYTLTIVIIGNGAVNKNPEHVFYAEGETVTLIAVPDLGWKFVEWGGDISGKENPAIIIMDSNKTVYVTFIQEQYILTIDVEGSGNVTKTPDQLTYTYGTQVQLTAFADIGWSFSYWSGNISSSENPITFIIIGNMTVTAHFKLKQYIINAAAGNTGGTIEPSGLVTVYHDEDITFTIAPNMGYHILDVLVDGESQGPISTYTFYTISANHTITAFFAPNEYTLTVNVYPEGSGSVTKNPDLPKYPYGTVVELTAIAENGWTFFHWSGNASGTNETITITIDGNKNITAVFVEIPTNWWNTSWIYRRTITINHTKVGGELTDFPVLIEIIDSSFAEKAQPDGDDFVFTDANHIKLDHQIEFYDSVMGHLIVWVKVPYLSPTTNSVLYMYYGNQNCGNQQNPTGVWDTNYKLIMHLNEGSGILYDSTINGNNGTPYGSLVQGATGYIGNCVEFKGGYIRLPRIMTTETQFTFSAWIYPRSGARYFISQYQSPYQGAFLQVFDNRRIELYVNNIIVSKPITVGRWYYVVATFDGTTARLYVNEGSPTFASASTPAWPSQNMYIGDRSDHVRKFYGFIDEVRVSNIARSAAWIITEYNNQLDPTAFYTIGPEEQYAGSSSNSLQEGNTNNLESQQETNLAYLTPLTWLATIPVSLKSRKNKNHKKVTLNFLLFILIIFAIASLHKASKYSHTFPYNTGLTIHTFIFLFGNNMDVWFWFFCGGVHG